MKNLILSLVLLFSVSTFAQKQFNEQEAKTALAKGMVSFVESVKPAYKTGMSYAQFQNTLTGGSRPTPEGAEMIRKAHEFISKNYSSEAILASYDGREVGAVLLKLESLKKSRGTATGQDIFAQSGGFTPYDNKISTVDTNRCVPWWDIFCQIKAAVIWIGDNQAAICFIAFFFGFPCP